MAQAPFVIQPRLTAITLAYRNQRLVADDVLPRIPVDSSVFKWSQYTLGDSFTVPDTRVGRKGDVNEIDWTATEQQAATLDYGLEDAIPQADILNARAAMKTQGVYPVDPEARSTELLSDLIGLDREVRVANLVRNPNNYPTANKRTLSGGAQWDQFATSTPIQDVTDARDSLIIPPNVMVMGRRVFTRLASHPTIVKAYNGTTGDTGIVPQQFIANLFEFDELIVGQGWINVAKKGQTPQLQRVWGNDALMFYRSPVVAAPTGIITFGYTAEWGQRLAGVIENDPDIGLRGGTRVRVGESVKEIVAAPNVAFLFQNAVGS
ncbi:major capsid protein [Ralstonia insidiosa]|uniref:Phage capsid protein n=1 Tax=Ralstonia insidiosa TaxID=190721 RepID=A0A848P0M0_9RALS|nr:major capsid protein [Ralstonia insidiosa]NMV37238.1 phage capsid protein [Ralstonia insidiosa]